MCREKGECEKDCQQVKMCLIKVFIFFFFYLFDFTGSCTYAPPHHKTVHSLQTSGEPEHHTFQITVNFWCFVIDVRAE